MDALARNASPLIADSAAPLRHRYPRDAVSILDSDERRRFCDTRGRPRNADALAWELLYRLEPELYAQLVAGERLHQGILEWLPRACGSVLEVGAGSGRLTLPLAGCARAVTAVEPAAPLREILCRRLAAAGVVNVEVVGGFFDELDAARRYDMVASCSAFSVDSLADPEGCLRAMEDACTPGGLLVLVWPADVRWLRDRGFAHVVFEGPMLVEYASADEATAIARIFYPHAASAVAQRRSRFVDFVTLGMNAPRDLCWKRVA